MYNEGISFEADLLNFAEKHGIVKKSGASYSFDVTKLGHGFDNAKNFLKENKKITNELLKKAKTI